MIPSQEMMMIITPAFSAVFAGFWILLAMAWIMNVDEIAQGRARRAAAATAAATQTESEGLNQVVPESDTDTDVSASGGEEVKPSTVSQEIFNALLKTVEEEKAKTDRMQQVIYQLLGGLYNHDTQEKTMMYDVNYLHGDKKTEEGAYETEEDIALRRKENRHPTTRQGDENAKQIAQLKEDFEAMRFHNVDTNEVYMRLHDLEEETKDHEHRLNKVSGGVGARWDETEKTFITIKTLEQRIQDLETMMSVCSAMLQEK
jgi:hypothetical protein